MVAVVVRLVAVGDEWWLMSIGGSNPRCDITNQPDDVNRVQTEDPRFPLVAISGGAWTGRVVS